MEDLKVLCFLRPGQEEFYRELLGRWSEVRSLKIIYCTEVYFQFKRLKKQGLDIYFINIKTKTILENSFSSIDFHDVIQRDRYLRSIDLPIAIKYVSSTITETEKIFDLINPHLVFSHLVDTFTVDVMHLLAAERGVSSLTMVWHSFGDYFKIYNHRKPFINKEIIEGYDILNYVKNHLDASNHTFSHPDTLKQRIINYLGDVRDMGMFYFYAGHHLGYRSTHSLYRISRTMARYKLNIRDLLPKYYNEVDLIESSKNNVYLSLHEVPEATIDYFIDNHEFINHDSVYLRIVKENPNLTFLVKDHPVMLNRRKLNFYNKLKRYNNVRLIHPNVSYSKVLSKVGFVVSYGGSIALEALSTNVIPINIGKPYFHPKALEFDIIKLNQLNFLQSMIDSIDYDRDTYIQIINKQLSRILFKGNMHEKLGNTESNFETLVKSLERFLESELISKISREV